MSDPVTGIIGGVTAIGSSLIGSSASKKAANAQAAAADKATATELAMYDQTRDDQQPWRAAGNASLSELQYLLGLGDRSGQDTSETNFDSAAYLAANPDVAKDRYWGANPYQHWLEHGRGENRTFTPLSTATHSGQYGDLNKSFTLADFTADPGYQFRMSEGLKGVQGSAAARGGLLSGGTLKALTQYGQDTASNEYSNAYNRWNNDNTTRFNRLSTLAGLGQTANNTLASVGQNTANSVASNQLAAGNAQASGYVGTANSISNGLGSLSSMYMLGKMFPT